ncbi:MAG: transporter substrate-binding domain-containing protein [Kaiparowitsia implicata GSE-PSE-MK54-09C]|jgi:polar amino acid transport system substrate-binding protein|nr:transporter substrate-binding domain-containing protein [Kaiparowitsia implicata GSE-PSE-MK54-09C]
MKQLKFLFTIIFSAVMAIAITTACAPSGTDTSTTTEGGAESTTLTMATSADYPPYEFIDSSSGSQEIVGFDIDIARAITEELGYALEIDNIDFNGLIPALQSNRADFVMAGMTPTEERRQNVDFSEIYFIAQNTIVSLADTGLTTAEDLDGKTVGVQLGSIQEGVAQEIAGANVTALTRISEIVQEVKVGRLDAAIIEDSVAKGFIESNPDLEFNVIPEQGEAGSAIAFPQGSPLAAEFNPVLERMIADGTIEGLAEKWFSEAIPEES